MHNSPSFEINPSPIWDNVIQASHHHLFDPAYVSEMGEYFRQQYQDELVSSATNWPEIPADVCRFPQRHLLPDVCWGFDLPILFTPKQHKDSVVALVSQDPLRSPKGGTKFTMATPWGFSDPKLRNKAANGRIWATIDALGQHGYSVYLTDAAKLYFHSSGPSKEKRTLELERSVLKAEMDLLQPTAIFAIGRVAERDLKKLEVETVNYLPHPTSWARYLKQFYGTKNATHPVIADKMKERVLATLGLEQ